LTEAIERLRAARESFFQSGPRYARQFLM